MHWGMSDSRWTIIPAWLGWPLAVSLLQRVPLSAQGLRKGWCLSLHCLGLAALGGQVLHSTDTSYGSVVGTFPSTNESDRNWFVKLNLCRKVDLCERERGLGAFCPSRLCWESLWLGEEAGKASVIHLTLFSFPPAVQWSNKGRPWTR